MIKWENTIEGMIQFSDVVYVDGKTIKHRKELTELTSDEIEKIQENLDDYYIVFYNSDSSKGDRVLKLSSKLVL